MTGIGGAYADTDPCLSEPTPRCLIGQMVKLINADHEPPWLTPELKQQLLFEARHWQIPTKSGPVNTEKINSFITLENEEQFLTHLRRQEWVAAEALLPELNSVMQDIGQSPPAAIMLEALTLELQDDAAAELKKNYYASLLSQSDTVRAHQMQAIAAHEILGGQPDKGRITLANTDIDAFSPPELFQAHNMSERLAIRAERLFLQPDKGMQNCSQKTDLGKTLHYLLSDDYFAQLYQTRASISATTQIKSLLMLAQLYHNSEQCSLLTLWLSSQAISVAAQHPLNNENAMRERIFLARTIRRYLL